MPPQQPAGPPANPYDFILNPQTRPKRRLSLPGLGGSSFAHKLVFIIGSAVIVIIAMWVIGGILSKNHINTADITSLAQTQEEIIRIAELGDDAVSQDTQNIAATTALSLTTQQKAWLDVLGNAGTTLKPEQLALKKDAAADDKLQEGRRNNAFDTTFTTILKTYLTQYLGQLNAAHDKSADASEKTLLESQQAQTKILLKQFK